MLMESNILLTMYSLHLENFFDILYAMIHTGISSEIRTKLRDWAIWQAGVGCYSQAALSSNDSKTLYINTDRLRDHDGGNEGVNNPKHFADFTYGMVRPLIYF